MVRLALYSMKGGVGKTVTAVNLSYCAAREGLKTLLVDLDPQGSASFYLRIRPHPKFRARKLLKETQIDQFVRGTDFENFDLLPAHSSLRKLDLLLTDSGKRPKGLLSPLSSLASQYELIVFDCPPGLSLVAEHLLRDADLILLPVIPTTLSQVSLDKLLQFCQKKKFDTRKLILFFSMVEKRKKLHREMISVFRRYPIQICSTVIPYSAEVEKMGLHRQPLPARKSAGAAAESFEQLWQDVKKCLANPDR